MKQGLSCTHIDTCIGFTSNICRLRHQFWKLGVKGFEPVDKALSDVEVVRGLIGSSRVTDAHGLINVKNIAKFRPRIWIRIRACLIGIERERAILRR